MKKIPVNIIAGFLGSGKTTAIIGLLRHKPAEESWAIIVNEFGKVSIDGQTLREASSAGTVFDISGGCICCSAKGYLGNNLETIIQSGNYQRIIIEPSGLGGIEMVTEISETITGLEIRPVICMVDIIATEKPGLQKNMIYRKQIEKADIIVFSKCDLLTGQELQDELINKFKALFPSKTHCISVNNLSSTLLDDELPRFRETGFSLDFAGNSELSDKNYQQKKFHFGEGTTIDQEKLIVFINKNPQIYRAKCHILTTNGWQLFNFTVSGFSFEPCPDRELTELVIITENRNGTPLHDFQDEIENICLSFLRKVDSMGLKSNKSLIINYLRLKLTVM